jgi:hypothetical protein
MGKRASPRKKWSARVTRESHALTLDEGRLPAKGELHRLFDKQKA